jgi:hypothetical protein
MFSFCIFHMIKVQIRNSFKGANDSMYEHPYIIKELQKQREIEIQKMVAETNMTKSKPLVGYLPYISRYTRSQGN